MSFFEEEPEQTGKITAVEKVMIGGTTSFYFQIDGNSNIIYCASLEQGVFVLKVGVTVRVKYRTPYKTRIVTHLEVVSPKA